MTGFAFPYRIGADGFTARPAHADHVRGLIEQVLFTRRGERINRPDFGAGVADLLFSENAPEMAAAAQHMIQAALQQWMSGVIEVRSVDARSDGSLLSITVWYRMLGEATDHPITLTRRM